MRSVVLILAAIVVIFLLPATVEAIGEFRAVDYVEPHIVATGVGETSANVVLTQSLFGGHTYNVTIESTNGSDAPLPTSYTTSTRTLNVSGLNADDTRTLTFTYKIDRLAEYWAAGIAARTWPGFLVIGIFGLIGGAVYDAYENRRGA